MASILGGVTGFFDKYVLGFALGSAAGPSLEPFVQDLANEAWSATQFMPLDAGVAAEVAAEDFASFSAMETEATLTGFNAGRFQHLYDVTLTAPGMGELLAMLRRGTINPGNFQHGLAKAKLEPMWSTPLAELQTVRLTPQQLALGIVRSTVTDPGLLVTTLDTSGSTIPKYPHWPGDALKEAAAGGVDADRLRVMVGSVGLPMSPQQAASAAFRQIINRQAFNLSILEGDIRPEYADAIFEQARQILTAEQYAELQLRGYLTEAQRRAGTQLHGMTDANSDLLYDVLGRGLNLHSAFIAERRGGVFDGPTDQIPAWALWMLQRGNLRPEVYNLAWAARESYPSAFVVRALLTDGAITEAQGEQIFLNIGYPDWLATTIAQHYAGGGGAAADPHVTKAQTQLWTKTHSSYVGEMVDSAAATPALEAAGVGAAAVPAVLTLWNHERALIRRQLTPAQIKKALNEGVANPATGAPWTHAEAVAALEARGYDQADATVLLAE